ncbi:MAG: hypothetical protein AABZ13_00790, partial [Planctomycetota bacterium]
MADLWLLSSGATPTSLYTSYDQNWLEKQQQQEDAWRGWLIPHQEDNKRTLYPIRVYPRLVYSFMYLHVLYKNSKSVKSVVPIIA